MDLKLNFEIDTEVAKLIIRHHSGQVDKAGEEYIHHLVRIANNMDTQNGKLAGLLHDILEDTTCSTDELKYCGIDVNIIKVILILTRKENEMYSEYISRIVDSRNETAIKVKLLDLEDNMDLSRLQDVTKKDIDRVNKRYKPAFDLLNGTLDTLLK